MRCSWFDDLFDSTLNKVRFDGGVPFSDLSDNAIGLFLHASDGFIQLALYVLLLTGKFRLQYVDLPLALLLKRLLQLAKALGAFRFGLCYRSRRLLFSFGKAVYQGFKLVLFHSALPLRRLI
jgi:membrane-associated PAP2 superfamily phosphatase